MLAACRHEKTDATPVWFMRQAGRSLARYRALREQYPILTLAKTPELCTRITVMPVDELGVDGAVLFADIMLPLEAMGVSLEIQPDLGPVIHEPIRDLAAVERLRPLEPEEGVPFVLEAIRQRAPRAWRTRGGDWLLRRAVHAGLLPDRRPPFTRLRAGKTLMMREPGIWAALMDRLTDGMISYLTAQVRAGADVIQVFDSWVGSLTPDGLRTLGPAVDEAHLHRLARDGCADHRVRHRQRGAARSHRLGRQRPGERRLARTARRRLAAHRLRPRHPGQPRPGAASRRLGRRRSGHARSARRRPLAGPATSSIWVTVSCPRPIRTCCGALVDLVHGYAP